MTSKKTVVLGASPNPGRYSFIATKMLSDYDHEVLPLGRRKGQIAGREIITDWLEVADAHTVTLYMNAGRQRPHYDYILGLNPERIIFNPGAENAELEQLAAESGIEALNACTLVMLRTGQY